MSRIQGKNTKPELVGRSLLHRMGYRFRLHRKDLPGRPDVVLPGRNVVVFVHGCFWHQHARCKYASIPKSKQEYWVKKLSDNVRRDKKNRRRLKKNGWQVGVIWECETRDEAAVVKRIQKILPSTTAT